MEPITAITKAIAAAGGRTALARMLGVSGPAVVYQWEQTRVPAEYCPLIEEATGVPCEEIRPDVKWAVLRCKQHSLSTQEA